MKFKEYLSLTVFGLSTSASLVLFDIFGASELNIFLFALAALALAAVAWKKPEWIFWLFLVYLPLEKIAVSPEGFPVSVRPFQLVGFVLVLTVVTKFLARKLPLKLAKPKIMDYFVFLLIPLAMLGSVNAPDGAGSVKLAVVLATFVAFFWVSRIFLHTLRQQLEALWFFALGAVPVVLFGFYQAIASKIGWPNFVVFEGRVNSTFTEPDWLAIYLALVLALEFLILLAIGRSQLQKIMICSLNAKKLAVAAAHFDLFLVIALLFLTVSRSAWIASALVAIAYLVSLYFLYQRPAAKIGINAAAVILVVVTGGLVVFLSGLSTFHFANRATSSVSGLQKITISCQRGSIVPKQIESMAVLEDYGCRHINLQQIRSELERGMVIKEAYRPDPNVVIRKNIYAKTWTAIKEHPFLGQGLGSSSVILGKDEHGSGLNSSNIFLEAWLSMGVVGLLAMLWLLIYPVGKAKLQLFRSKWAQREMDSIDQFRLLFIFVTAGAIVIPNLFNSGMLLGFFWVWLAGVVSAMDEKD